MQAFISHSSKDHGCVEWVAREVDALGVRAYLAEHDPKAGEQLSEKVCREIENSDVVIVLFTRNGYNSPYVQQEIGVAIQQGKLIIPLVDPELEGAPLAMLAGLEYIPFDFQGRPNGSADLLSRLRDVAANAERSQEAARRQQQRERIRDGLIVATLVVAVLYAATHPPESVGIALPTTG
jgi:hypothetical protein